MVASSAEREIRDAGVAWWHKHEPRARIIHELPLNGFSEAGRVDLAAVFPDCIVTMEIKSERDKLSRLEKQFTEMSRRSHDWKIIAHDKWWDGEDGLKGQDWMKWSHREHLWGYPDQSRWSFDRYRTDRVVGTQTLLAYLHVAELRACYEHAGVMASSPRLNQYAMINDLYHKLTGRQIVRAVCAMLRAREFAEADDPIPVAA